MLIDTHCHIHDKAYPLDPAVVLREALQAGVNKLIVVGTDRQSSLDAIEFADRHDQVYASVGIHPHDAKNLEVVDDLMKSSSKIIAVGEVGLDYFYQYSQRSTQIRVLEQQLQLAHDSQLPVIFHVRGAFEDFWPVFDNFPETRGVLHSFTDSWAQAEAGLQRGLLVGINGISTFTKDLQQQAMYAKLPLDKIVLETDAPFLTPSPFRGKVNTPSMVVEVARFHAAQRGMTLTAISAQTTSNAELLFNL